TRRSSDLAIGFRELRMRRQPAVAHANTRRFARRLQFPPHYGFDLAGPRSLPCAGQRARRIDLYILPADFEVVSLPVHARCAPFSADAQVALIFCAAIHALL